MIQGKNIGKEKGVGGSAKFEVVNLVRIFREIHRDCKEDKYPLEVGFFD